MTRTQHGEVLAKPSRGSSEPLRDAERAFAIFSALRDEYRDAGTDIDDAGVAVPYMAISSALKARLPSMPVADRKAWISAYARADQDRGGRYSDAVSFLEGVCRVAVELDPSCAVRPVARTPQI